MKTRNYQQRTAPQAFNPKPLTLSQETAIDALLIGKSDRAAGEQAGVTRWAVQGWRTKNPLFIATLHQRREERFSGAADRLRSLLDKALDNIQGAVESGNVRASFELLKATGLYGFMPPTGELDVQKIFDYEVLRLLAQEKHPGSFDELMNKLNNSSPEKDAREAEIRAALTAEFGEPADTP